MADSLRDYGLAAPHGPNMTGHHTATQDVTIMNPNERDIFNHLIMPDDSYTNEGVYWADLSLPKRAAFTASVDAQESKRELKAIGRMMKKDPLSPIGWYMRNAVIPGAGLLLEG
jgi:hypothetical protein